VEHVHSPAGVVVGVAKAKVPAVQVDQDFLVEVLAVQEGLELWHLLAMVVLPAVHIQVTLAVLEELQDLLAVLGKLQKAMVLIQAVAMVAPAAQQLLGILLLIG
jgi:hypothetical protein